MARLVLDTSTISQILRKNPRVLGHLTEAVDSGDDLYICPVVLYELRRGLAYRDARRQLENLDAFARALRWVDYERETWIDAALLWADGRRRGLPRDDADLLIAAFTRQLRAAIVTSDTGDFMDLGIRVIDWTLEG